MIQTRSEKTGLGQFNTLQEAFDASKKDATIWKISFTLNGENVRLVRKFLNGVGSRVATNCWEPEPMPNPFAIKEEEKNPTSVKEGAVNPFAVPAT